MSRQTRASVNTCIVLVVSSAGSERINFGRGGARRRRGRVGLQLQRCSAWLSLYRSAGRPMKQHNGCTLMLYTNIDTSVTNAL